MYKQIKNTWYIARQSTISGEKSTQGEWHVRVC
jgi:hypothetical protein